MNSSAPVAVTASRACVRAAGWPPAPSSSGSSRSVGNIGLVQIVLALALGVGIWVVSMKVLRMLTNPPPEIDPDDVVAVEDQDYKCMVCGTEVTLRVSNAVETSPPRHCREDMEPVWRPGRHLRK